MAITGVAGTNPGNNPTVSFTLSDNKGNPVDATKLTALAFVLAGPTTDYTFPSGVPASENALTTVKATSTGFTYTLQAAIPANAKGTTLAIGAQAYLQVSIPGPVAGHNLTVRDIMDNPVFYFGVGGATPVVRRTVVSVANCNVCHSQLAVHGGARLNTEYCVLCHNPAAGDTQTPPQTVNFRTHIHRIHRGVDLENDWTINGTNNFNGVLFPGDLRDCAKCHVGASNQVPLPDGLADANTPRLFYSPMKPTAQACLGCHDGVDMADHAYQMAPTAATPEACLMCHGETADFAVTKVHAR
jgi:OmcA/MtrC family decaheme c-type cytochrome